MAIKVKKVDPITVAVLNSRFEAINEEMGRALVRSSRCVTWAEAKDFAVGIFDKDVRLVAQKEYVPVLAGALPISLEDIAAAYEGDINEGDIFIHNDPYGGNTHLGDLNIAKPVFYNGELMFWSMIKGHIPDIGSKGIVGTDPTSKSIFEDGLTIPPIKLYDRGKLNRTFKDFFLHNLKLSDLTWGEIMCEVGGVLVGERHLLEMLNRYGPETVYGAIDEILKAAEREVREMIRKIPDGIYYGEHSTDHDVLGNRDKPVTARVKITIKGDELTIDLSDSDPTAVGYINSSLGNTHSICQLIVAYALPGLVKRNKGSTMPIKIVAPEGRWVNPTFPAPVAKCTTQASECIGEAILMASSEAIPSSVAAAHGKLIQYISYGFNPRTKRMVVTADFLMSCAPSGGTEGYDGWDLGGPLMNLGSGQLPDIEIVELLGPLHILQHEQEMDSAGAGKFRSGLGHAYKIQFLADVAEDCCLVGSGMRDYVVPAGLFGGKSPKPNRVTIYRADSRVEKPDNNVVLGLCEGDVMESHLMGGGGFGDPYERDIEKVREDVINEVVSIEGARKDYGVVIDPVTMEIDYKSTEKLRKARKTT